MPESTDASTSFTTRTSTNRSRSPGIVRAGAALRTRRVRPLLAAERFVDRFERDLELGEEQVGGLDARHRGADDDGRARAVGPRRHDDRVLAACIEGDCRESRRSLWVHVEAGQVDAGRCDRGRRDPPIVVVPHRADKRRRGPESRARPPGSPPCRRSPGSCRVRARSRRGPAAGRRGGTGRR